MNYKACHLCKHLNWIPYDNGFLVFCDRLSPIVRDNVRRCREGFSEDEIALVTYRDALVNVSPKYNKDFVLPEGCEYLLEHTVNQC
jgi:hypothetical protein